MFIKKKFGQTIGEFSIKKKWWPKTDGLHLAFRKFSVKLIHWFESIKFFIVPNDLQCEQYKFCLKMFTPKILWPKTDGLHFVFNVRWFESIKFFIVPNDLQCEQFEFYLKMFTPTYI